MKKSALEYSIPRDVVSVVLRDVGFGVTGWYSDFGGGGGGVSSLRRPLGILGQG